jgi:uncharacterized membrane protein HdeD (DUF308 family)
LERKPEASSDDPIRHLRKDQLSSRSTPLAFPEPLTQERLRARISATIASHWQQTLALGVLLELLGLAAFAMPLLSTLAVDILVGWLFMIGGIARVVTLLRARHWPGFWWSLASGVVATILGIAMVFRPLAGVLTLTMALAVVFFVEGVSAIVAGFDFRHHARNWIWLLLSGMIDFLLVFVIWSGWPGTAVWAIGVLVGVNLFVGGLSLIMLSFTARRQ